jgi:serine/threonine-protein kinase SRPK3
MQLLDHFDHTGPNGTHRCLVLELLGPSVLSEAESYPSNRLPGNIAWQASK